MNAKQGAIIIEGHVQGLSNARALGEAGIPVYVVDKDNCLAQFSKYCKKFFKCPSYEQNTFADFLIKLAQEENLSDWLLLPSNDFAVMTISRHRDALKKHFLFMTPAVDQLMNIYDKGNLVKVAQKCQVPTPRTWLFNTMEPAADLEYPVLIKGRKGLPFYKAMKQKAFIAANAEELKAQLKMIAQKIDVAEAFAQELIPFTDASKTISVTAFCIEGEIKTYWMGEKLREHPSRFGTATYAQSVRVEECLKQSARLLEELRYNGICEIEYLQDPRNKSYKLIEINARTWLWVGLAKRCGVNFALILYNYSQNGICPSTVDYPVGVKWMHYVTDIPNSIEGILKRRYSLQQIASSYAQGPAPAVFSIKDPLPFLAELFLLPHFILRR